MIPRMNSNKWFCLLTMSWNVIKKWYVIKSDCGNHKQCHVIWFGLVWHVEIQLDLIPHCASVLSLLDQGYSVRDIERRTGLGKSTVGRIKKEMDTDKENNSGGHPSKLSTHDKASIVCQIQSGKLDTAVQATNFINAILVHPVHPQTIRRALKESGFHSATKKKVPMLKKTHRQKWLEFAQQHEN